MENNKNNNEQKNEKSTDSSSTNKPPNKEYSLIEETYKILTGNLLGGGSFGHVYKCLNVKTKVEYSVK